MINLFSRKPKEKKKYYRLIWENIKTIDDIKTVMQMSDMKLHESGRIVLTNLGFLEEREY